MRMILRDLIQRRWWMLLLCVWLIGLGLLASSIDRIGRMVVLTGMLFSGLFLGIIITGAPEQYSGVNHVYATLPVAGKKLRRLAWAECAVFPALVALLFFIISAVSPRTSWLVWPDAGAFFCACVFGAGLISAALLILPPDRHLGGFWLQQARALLSMATAAAYFFILCLLIPWFDSYHKTRPPWAPRVATLTITCLVSAGLIVLSYRRFGLPVQRWKQSAGPAWKRRGAPRFVLTRPWVWFYLNPLPLAFAVWLTLIPLFLKLIEFGEPNATGYLVQMSICHWWLFLALAMGMACAPPAVSMRVLRTLPVSCGRLSVTLNALPCAVWLIAFAGIVIASGLLGFLNVVPEYLNAMVFALAAGVLLNAVILRFYHPLTLLAGGILCAAGTMRLFCTPRNGDLVDGPLVGGLGTPGFWICSALVVVSLAVSLFVLRRAIERHEALYRCRRGPGWNIEFGN